MTEWVLALVPQYGLWLLAVTTFLSCLALPFPASILMMTAGGFAAAGDLVLWQAFAAATGGAIAGDQLGFRAGRSYGPALIARLRQDPVRDRLLDRTVRLMDRRGMSAIFLSRWLVSPLGPYVNVVAGSTGYSWPRFTLAATLGEIFWAGLYVGTGYVFAGNIEAAGELLSSILGLVGGAAAVLALGLWLWSARSSDIDEALPQDGP